MKALNPKYKGTTWTNGNFPKPIVFDEMTPVHIPFLERIGFDFLVIEVCDNCQKEKCRCKKEKDVKKKDEAGKK